MLKALKVKFYWGVKYIKRKKIKYIQIEESNYDIYQNKNNINASEVLKQLNFILDKKIIFRY